MNKIGTRKIDTKKIHVMGKYKLSEKVEYCKKCVLSNQGPRIAFDENGVCNACLYWERKGQVVDWKTREKELKDLCDRFRRKNGRHDVVVPSSGGKDSAFVAHQLKYKYKMNPLTITWAPNMPAWMIELIHFIFILCYLNLELAEQQVMPPMKYVRGLSKGKRLSS